MRAPDLTSWYVDAVGKTSVALEYSDNILIDCCCHQTPERTYCLHGESVREAKHWVESINDARAALKQMDVNIQKAVEQNNNKVRGFR